MASTPVGEQIDLEKLSLEQLQQIKAEFQSEVEAIQDSIQTLYNCKAKFATSKEALEQIQPDWQNKEILVPLTSSMYVPGAIKDTNSFVIDVGTGYYVEKDLETSKDYFKRRVEYMQEQMEKIEKIQYQKSRFLSVLINVMEQKQQQLQQQMAKQSA